MGWIDTIRIYILPAIIRVSVKQNLTRRTEPNFQNGMYALMATQVRTG